MKGLSGFVAFSAAMGISMSVSATEIHVMSGGAPQEVFALLTPKFEQQTGNKVKFTYAVITALREKLAAGEKADVLVMPVPLLDGYRQGRQAARRGRATFGNVGISVVVKEARPSRISRPRRNSGGDARRPLGRACHAGRRRRAARTWAR